VKDPPILSMTNFNRKFKTIG